MMSSSSCDNPSLHDQYSNSANLDARIQLHARFSTNSYGFHRWVFDHYDFQKSSKILELGCGNGAIWKANYARISPTWEVVLSDFSAGMLRDAEKNLAGKVFNFSFKVIDAQAIPYDNGIFDVVIANHMLYHVPDRKKALAEIGRVLKKTGKLVATSAGERHLKELTILLQEFDPAIVFGNQITGEFSLENGPEQLADFFSNITVEHYEDSLVVPEAGPIIDYVLSSTGMSNAPNIITGSKIAEFKLYLENIIKRVDAIRITKDSGILIANNLSVNSGQWTVDS
jgi:ubiquinone/menaquinone biosynthesis C-methylase UbiE